MNYDSNYSFIVLISSKKKISSYSLKALTSYEICSCIYFIMYIIIKIFDYFFLTFVGASVNKLRRETLSSLIKEGTGVVTEIFSKVNNAYFFICQPMYDLSFS